VTGETIGVYIYTTDMEPVHTADLPDVPSEGDHITVHNGLYKVETVTWEFDAREPTVQLRCEVIDGGAGLIDD